MTTQTTSTYHNLQRFKSGRMTAVAQIVYKLPDGTIPVFRSYKAASVYAKSQGLYRTYAYPLHRLTTRHRIMEEATPQEVA